MDSEPPPKEVDPTLRPPAESNPIRHLKSLLTLGLAAVSLGLFGGCGIFSPEKDDGGGPPPPGPPVYLVPSRPNFALENLRRAYEARDSVQADTVYHVDYRGESSNAVDPGTVLFFTKDQEVSHIGALRKDPNITNVVFNIGHFDSWDRGGSLDFSHPEWASITLSRGIRLEVYTSANLYTVGTDDFFEFQFAPLTPAASSPTDTLWQIVRWRELKGVGG